MNKTTKSSAKKNKQAGKTIELPRENLSADLKKEIKRNLKSPWKTIIPLMLVILIIAAWQFKGMFIAATVNGQPVMRWELTGKLYQKYAQSLLDSIVNERLILAAARDKGVVIDSSMIGERIEEVRGQLGSSTSLEDALKAQGASLEEFRRQIEIQLSVEKMFENEATVSAEEVDEYIASNKALFQESTDTAKIKTDAENILKQQKLSESFTKWFDEVKKSAKISIYVQ